MYLVMPTVQSFYQIICHMAVLLHLIMYAMLFVSVIVLRYTHKDIRRPFRVGRHGNFLIWMVGLIGIVGVLLAFILSFFPPEQIRTGNTIIWFSILIIVTLIFTSIPFIIFRFKKNSWKQNDVNELL